MSMKDLKPSERKSLNEKHFRRFIKCVQMTIDNGRPPEKCGFFGVEWSNHLANYDSPFSIEEVDEILLAYQSKIVSDYENGDWTENEWIPLPLFDFLGNKSELIGWIGIKRGQVLIA